MTVANFHIEVQTSTRAKPA